MTALSFVSEIEEGPAGPVVRLVGDLDIEVAEALGRLLEGLTGRFVSLDFGLVTVMDEAVVAHIMAAVRRAETEGGGFLFLHMQPAQRGLLDELGVSDALSFKDA